MILEKAQAEAVYSAMCALNNVGAKARASFGSVIAGGVNVFEVGSAGVCVARIQGYDVMESEKYESKQDFAAAYGLEA